MSENAKGATNELTEDALFEGRLILHQPARGYRFSVDAPLLIWFASEEKPVEKCADLGAGSGTVGLGLLAAGTIQHAVAVEIQPRLAEISTHNARLNGFLDQFHVVSGDMQTTHPLLEPSGFDLVVSNPPFWPADSGRLPAEAERQVACHEVRVDLMGVVDTAARLLKPKRGRLCMVFPAKRTRDLMLALEKNGLHPSRARFVHPHTVDPALLVLLEARQGHQGQLSVLPPLFLKDQSGNNTDMANHVLTGQFSETLKCRMDRRKAAS